MWQGAKCGFFNLFSRAPMLALAFDGALLTLQLNRPQFAPLSQLPPTITVRQSNKQLGLLWPPKTRLRACDGAGGLIGTGNAAPLMRRRLPYLSFVGVRRCGRRHTTGRRRRSKRTGRKTRRCPNDRRQTPFGDRLHTNNSHMQTCWKRRHFLPGRTAPDLLRGILKCNLRSY